MKKFCIIFLFSIIISLTAIGFARGGETAGTEQGEYLRIHIRADSNEPQAQAVKYRVRDDVVAFLTPLVAEYADKESAMVGVENALDKIAQVASGTLLKNGFLYGATATLETEEFPTRVYDGYTLPAGEYSALIIRLGSGAGDNWWCVVYPPLCFSKPTGTNIKYKSKIAEIIRAWKEK